MKKILEKKQKGITLIALVITIIVLIILAGVAINLTLGQNGLLNRTKEAREKYEIASAKEYIELKIDECIIEKGGDASLQDIIDYLAEDSNVTYYVALEEVGLVAGEVDIGSPKEIYVVYNSYQFKVNESKKVEFISIVDVDLEGKVSIEAQVKEHLGKNADEKYEAKVLLKATGDAEISKLEIEKPDGTTLTLEPDGLTTVGKDITIEFDKTYKVILITANGHRYTKKIIEKSEETIMNAEQLASFRDRVNSGLTYEGKTVKLGADIDLSTVCGANVGGKEVSWEPIGTETTSFKGTFDGNEYSVNNLYVLLSENEKNGLFMKNIGIIKNIILENIKITGEISKEEVQWGYTMTGGIVAENMENGIIENIKVKSGNIGTNSNYVKSGQVGAICGKNNGNILKCINMIEIYNIWPSVGGISGYNEGTIEECVNKANLYNKQAHLGGIVGQNNNIIKNCYSIGNETIIGSFGACGGIAGVQTNGIVQNCYSIGNQIANSSANSIIGAKNRRKQ